ncbi:LPS export ABC transporter permease LptF [Herbaspirillum sp. RTI4]|uniref:LPS export ABC transporter permease LptF n=1 Tax=Herbaspirillum sp. RTI4 TaxID=3048640 RepID=UPI002AB3545F|nr:LPS export ABC transporter permease LptF [Herbaspirillum sp. RTI4]MDY7578157.1 LPS export ABC transporter permease LptF [Herbaspirillum sp. RTI4]MEA9980746.1 LPS export ABC transporter permease LptF [Herbaspirillum sp. RTI4]
MIFQRALRRELVSTAGAVFTTLFTITITVMLVKILGQAAGGQINSGDVLALIGFQALNYLPVILILTGFISVLLVVTRSYQDSEMVVWFASGMSLTRWVAPILRFGWPIIVLTVVLSFVATPWANQKSAEFRARFEKRDDIARVSPGKFQESASANRIFFVEGFSGDATKVKNIFINTVREDGKSNIVVAREGEMQTDQYGQKFVVMEKGRRYDGMPDQANFQMIEFQRYGILVGNTSQTAAGDKSARELSTLGLLQKPTNYNLAELMWRVSLPLMALLLMLLAIPLSFVNPRAGRSIGLLIALLLFVTYSNMVSFLQATVAQGRLSFMMGWWPIHLAILLLTGLLFLWRLNVNSRYHPLVFWLVLRRAVLLRQ